MIHCELTFLAFTVFRLRLCVCQSFFCRYNEASYVKFKKIEILTSISTEDNVEAIVEELAAYITDVDVEFARRSLQAVGNIAIRYVSKLGDGLSKSAQSTMRIT